jgi:elongation factor 1 alpha-like protein
MQGLAVGEPRQQQDGAAPAAAADQQAPQQQAAQPPPPRRPLSEYQPDAELAAACRAAATAEASGGGKPRLHLVVLGHVDAGKSTLMGRMLYELGLVTDKAVHKTQAREAEGMRTA